jgi:hypothetical protein
MKSIPSPTSAHQIEAAWVMYLLMNGEIKMQKIFHQLFCFQVTVQERLFGQKI